MSLTAGLASAADTMNAIQQAIDAVQNNIVNASTPGYAAQRINFSAQRFDPSQGQVGGVDVSLSSTRDQYLEQSVRIQTSALGLAEQSNPLFSTLQNAFSASGDSGVPGALTSFSNAFATLASSPTDQSALVNGLQSAQTVALAFNQTATWISQVSAGASQQAASTVAQINALAAHIASDNAEIQSGAQNDAGVSADLNSSLDSLSELVNISVTTQSDGSVSVLMGGQAALVIGAKASGIDLQSRPPDSNSPYPMGDSGIILVDASGADVTALATQGKLGALLQVRNQTIPYYLGSQNQPGALNQLAKSFASRVNTIVTNAQTAAGAAAVPLFSFSADDTQAAATLAVTGITANQIVMTNAGGSNGVANELADITNPTNPSDLMSNGMNFSAFYGQMSAKAGADASNSTANLQIQQDLATQAQNQRDQVSGVSINDQAAQLLNLQQAYQATARVITILNNLTQTTVNLIPES